MKKLALTIAIVLTMGIGAYAQYGGLLGFGPNPDGDPGEVNTTPLILPGSHGDPNDADGETPLGSGIAVLAGLGAAYFVAKKRREK